MFVHDLSQAERTGSEHPTKTWEKQGVRFQAAQIPAQFPRKTAQLTPVVGECMWNLKVKDGEVYGPVPRSQLDQWYAEERITADCRVLQQEADQWQWATDLYPDLVPEEPVQSETFSLGENKVCPVCGGQILAVAKKCKHCGEFLVKDMRRESQTVRSETDVFAILTLITGVVGLWPLCLIFSIVSHNRPKNNAHLTGKGIRYFGVVLGALWAIFTMVQLGIW